MFITLRSNLMSDFVSKSTLSACRWKNIQTHLKSILLVLTETRRIWLEACRFPWHASGSEHCCCCSPITELETGAGFDSFARWLAFSRLSAGFDWSNCCRRALWSLSPNRHSLRWSKSLVSRRKVDYNFAGGMWCNWRVSTAPPIYNWRLYLRKKGVATATTRLDKSSGTVQLQGIFADIYPSPVNRLVSNTQCFFFHLYIPIVYRMIIYNQVTQCRRTLVTRDWVISSRLIKSVMTITLKTVTAKLHHS